ncbi:MAG TPA: hypothetical protein PL112_08575 [Candidatus Obscuribacter sp.]|nr:hypothetical protein [Candidatus Obscuribacter sp.]HND04991.1 hypothetical protein [Candidatus Obscuribacter sp.]HND66835.1 hypothetical protein [Candidatus Obscuribacter sp.]HNG77344.1 hypothetical protein [Candidatus Obscuribacter sp.]
MKFLTCLHATTKHHRKTVSALALLLAISTVAAGYASAAEDLRLKKGISFNQDTDTGFPIEATRMEDVELEPGKASVIFFGASGDLNVNRQAKRMVDLYKQNSTKPVKFILVDVDHPVSSSAKALIKNHYKGYIPFQVILDKAGKVSWSQIGEVETGTLANQLDKALAQ